MLICAVIAIPAFAQKQHNHKQGKPSHKEMLQFKLNYLADEIDVKGDTKKQFEELYSQMESERRAIFKKMKAAEKSIADNKNASEADYDKAYKEIADAKAEMAQIEKKYDDKFAALLSKKQLFKLKEAEQKYNDRIRGCRDKKRGEAKK